MLQISNLNIYHSIDLHYIIRELNFVINAGDKVGLIGEEGTGKSTVMRWIKNPEYDFSYLEIEGNMSNTFKCIGYVPQFLEDIDKKKLIHDLIFSHTNYAEIDYNYLYKLASVFNISDLINSNRTMEELSGGEQLKVLILKALIVNPDLLLLDEPSNNLDIESMKWLEQFIINSDLTIIFISHDERLLRNTTKGIIHLELHKNKKTPENTVSNLNYKNYIDERNNKLINTQQIALKQREEYSKKVKELNEVKSKVHSKLETTKSASAGQLLKKKMRNLKARKKRFEKEKELFKDIPKNEELINLKYNKILPVPSRKELINLSNETIDFENNIRLTDITLRVQSNDKIGIIGNNGVGKTRFLIYLKSILANLETISLGYMPQDYACNLDYVSSSIDYLKETGSKDERTQIMTLLGNMQFTLEEMSRPIATLSGGQKAKLLLLEMELRGNNVLLLDEPTRNISPLSQPLLRNTLKGFKGTIISVSHDELFLTEVCDTVYKLERSGLELINIIN